MPQSPSSDRTPRSAETIATWIAAEIVGDASVEVSDAAPLEKAIETDLVYVASAGLLSKLAESKSRLAIVGLDLRDQLPTRPGLTCLLVEGDPQAAFVEVLAKLRKPRARRNIGISPQAFVSDTATIGAGTNVHPMAHVGDDVVIGENCDILPGAYVGPGCRLGNEVVLHPYAVLYHDVELGDRVVVHATTVVGADGFGYRFEAGRHAKIPHFGNVRIEDDVEIGPSSTIDRGMIADTIVGEGTKIDNLVQIAHNCELGRHNVFVAQVGMAGSVTTGDFVVCAGQVGIADHVHLGTGAVLGSKAGVTKDVPDGETWIGQPAQPAQDTMRSAMALKKLPDMRQQLRKIESRIAQLEADSDDQAAAA